MHTNHQVGQHMKKSSLSESSSDMMDLDDGVESTPGLTDTHPGRSAVAPFLGAQQQQQPVASSMSMSIDKQLQHPLQQLTQTQLYQQQQQQQNGFKQQQQQQQTQQQQSHTINASAAAATSGSGSSGLTMRHNNALAVSIETDVWLLGKCWITPLACCTDPSPPDHHHSPIYITLSIYILLWHTHFSGPNLKPPNHRAPWAVERN